MNGPLFLGVEIGGTKLQVGLGAADGGDPVIVRAEVEAGARATRVLDQVRGCWEVLLKKCARSATDVAAVGVGFGGPVDMATGSVLKSHQVGGWEGLPLTDWFRHATGCPHVVVRNDADTAALAEARFGAGRGISPLLYVTVGTGIGGGLVVDGKIYQGTGKAATELGHLWVPTEAGLQHLEDVSSGKGIADHAKLTGTGSSTVATTKEIGEAARRGDPSALALLKRARDALAFGLAQAITLLAPRRIILGGGVSLIGEDLWIGPIRAELTRWEFESLKGTYDLVASSLGEEVVVHGALALARDLHEGGEGASDRAPASIGGTNLASSGNSPFQPHG